MLQAGSRDAAVTALLADMTRDAVRTKAMALVGASIGLMFALSLVLAPILAQQIGLSGLFVLTGVLVIVCMAVVAWVVPPEPPLTSAPGGRLNGLKDVLVHADLLRLDLGAFILHAVQLAMWVAIPAMLVQAGLGKAAHWQVYLPAVLLSFVFMGALFALEARGYLKVAFLGSVALIGAARAGLGLGAGAQRLAFGLFAVCLFCGLQHFGSLPAQPGLAGGPRACARRGAGGVQHRAVPGLFRRRLWRRLAG